MSDNSGFSIKEQACRSMSGNMGDMAKSLDRMEDEIRSIRGSLRYKIISEGNIRNILNRAAEALNKESRNMNTMGNTLDGIIRQYETTEKKITDYKRKWDTYINSGEVSGAVWGADGRLDFSQIGIDGHLSGETDFLGGSLSGDYGAAWDWKEGNVGAAAHGSAEGHLFHAEGEAQWGIFQGAASGSILSAGAAAAGEAFLFKDGKFSPGIYGKAEAEASAAKGEVSGKIGTDDYNIHSKAEGKLLSAKAEAEGGIGRVGENDDGEAIYGVKGKAGASAYLAEGEISSGFNIFGIEVDLGVSGKAGGAGVEVGGELTTGGVEVDLGAGLGLGLGLDLKVDWSNADFPTFSEIGQGIEDMGNAIGNAGAAAWDGISNAGAEAWNGIGNLFGW